MIFWWLAFRSQGHLWSHWQRTNGWRGREENEFQEKWNHTRQFHHAPLPCGHSSCLAIWTSWRHCQYRTQTCHCRGPRQLPSEAGLRFRTMPSQNGMMSLELWGPFPLTQPLNFLIAYPRTPSQRGRRLLGGVRCFWIIFKMLLIWPHPHPVCVYMCFFLSLLSFLTQCWRLNPSPYTF